MTILFIHSEGSHSNAKSNVFVAPAENKMRKMFVDVSLLVVRFLFHSSRGQFPKVLKSNPIHLVFQKHHDIEANDWWISAHRGNE